MGIYLNSNTYFS